MLLAALLLTATVAAEPTASLNVPDIPALAKRLDQRVARNASAADSSNHCRALVPTPTAAAEAPGAKRLDQLPPAHQFLTVLRKEHGCEVAVIRENGRDHIVPLPDQRGLQPLESRWLSR